MKRFFNPHGVALFIKILHSISAAFRSPDPNLCHTPHRFPMTRLGAFSVRSTLWTTPPIQAPCDWCAGIHTAGRDSRCSTIPSDSSEGLLRSQRCQEPRFVASDRSVRSDALVTFVDFWLLGVGFAGRVLLPGSSQLLLPAWFVEKLPVRPWSFVLSGRLSSTKTWLTRFRSSKLRQARFFGISDPKTKKNTHPPSPQRAVFGTCLDWFCLFFTALMFCLF